MYRIMLYAWMSPSKHRGDYAHEMEVHESGSKPSK
jgi:hypothetical protein